MSKFKLTNYYNKDTQTLDLSHNELEEIPKEVFTFTQARIIKLNNNKITVINDDIKLLTHAQQIDLSENKIVHLPGALEELIETIEMIDVSGNELQTIDYSLSRLFWNWKGKQRLSLIKIHSNSFSQNKEIRDIINNEDNIMKSISKYLDDKKYEEESSKFEPEDIDADRIEKKKFIDDSKSRQQTKKEINIQRSKNSKKSDKEKHRNRDAKYNS